MQVLRQCSCALRQARNVSTPRIRPYSTTPWFVTEPQPVASTSHAVDHVAPAAPTPPPHDLPRPLVPLHQFMSVSPFLRPESIAFIDAKESDPDAWVDWICLATLKEGRERGIRGAVDSVRQFLAREPIGSISDAIATDAAGLAARKPSVTGLPSAPSRHARARTAARGPRTKDQPDWAMIDQSESNLVVHILTEEARSNWGIEELWQKIGKEHRRELM